MTTNADDSNVENKIKDSSQDAEEIEFGKISTFDPLATQPTFDPLATQPTMELLPLGSDAKRNERTKENYRTSEASSVGRNTNYELIRQISHSPRSMVYRAKQLGSNRRVIFKLIISKHLSVAANADGFRNDMEAASRLSHPGIISIIEWGSYDGQTFVSMEHVEGGFLGDPPNEGPVSSQQAADIAQRIAVAVAYAHEKGVIHGNLIPSNVLLNVQKVPLIIGFGQLSSLEPDTSLFPPSGVRGTPGFLAPEQVRNQTGMEGPLVDVYAVGGILYFLLTGRAPFQTSSPEFTLRKVLESDPVPPAVLNPLVHADLEAICLKCLSKDPRRRYSRASDLADDLGRWSRGEVVHAKQASAWSQILQILRTHRILKNAAFAVAIVTLMAVLMLAKSIHDRRILRERANGLEEEIQSLRNEVIQKKEQP